MNKDAPIVAASYVSPFLDFLGTVGVDLETMATTAGIDLSHIISEQRPLSLNDIFNLLRLAGRHLNLTHGMSIGQSMNLAVHGMAGVSAMSQLTYGECLQSATRFCEKVFPPLNMEYFETEHHCGLRVYEVMSLTPYTHYFIEALMVNFYNILHFLLGRDNEPEYLAFPYPTPEYHSEFKKYFSCPLRFNYTHAEFVVSKSLAQRSLALANEKTAAVAEQNFMKSVPPVNLNSVPTRLRQVLTQSNGTFPSLEEAAQQLGMSGRTLRRQLNALGTNFQNELDALRKEWAIDLLLNTDKCITDIALILGFCDSSAFSKAFKKWTGHSPREFKKQHVDQKFRTEWLSDHRDTKPKPAAPDKLMA